MPRGNGYFAPLRKGTGLIPGLSPVNFQVVNKIFGGPKVIKSLLPDQLFPKPAKSYLLFYLFSPKFPLRKTSQMQFDLEKSIQVLERTPRVIEQMLNGLDETWVKKNMGEGTWSPFDVLGHLIHGEKTDWIPRMRIILERRLNHPFPPFDRYAMVADNKGKKLKDLAVLFKQLRAANILALRQAKLNEKRLNLKGIHPNLGQVTLKQLIAAWVVHDLNHIAQISRVMSWQYRHEVGPWKKYLGLLDK